MSRHSSPAQSAGRSKLVPLSASPEFRLAPGEPDIRGWGLFANSGNRVGTVDEILIDPETNEVGALVITKEVPGATGGGRIALPIDRVSIDEQQRAVFSDAATDVSDSLPSHDEPRQAEPSNARGVAGDVAARTGGASVTGATVERMADGEQVIKVPIVEEELVVERRPVVKEVVVIRKRPVQESRTVEADLRKERLEIDRKDTR